MSKQIWRLLEKQEQERIGDQFATPDGGWSRWKPGMIVSIVRRLETLPDWPAPRDARTDPPEPRISHTIVLAWSWKSKQWSFQSVNFVINPEFTHWLPLPPTPDQKSDVELAWEKQKDLPWNTMKKMFIAGFEAAKKGQP